MSTEIVKFTSEEMKRIGSKIVSGSKKDMKKAGSLLVKSAIGRADSAFAEKILARVQELIQHRSNLFVARDKLLREINLFDRRIAAIENGKFRVGFSGIIIFEDSTLGETWQ